MPCRVPVVTNYRTSSLAHVRRLDGRPSSKRNESAMCGRSSSTVAAASVSHHTRTSKWLLMTAKPQTLAAQERLVGQRGSKKGKNIFWQEYWGERRSALGRYRVLLDPFILPSICPDTTRRIIGACFGSFEDDRDSLWLAHNREAQVPPHAAIPLRPHQNGRPAAGCSRNRSGASGYPATTPPPADAAPQIPRTVRLASCNIPGRHSREQRSGTHEQQRHTIAQHARRHPGRLRSLRPHR
jgi:hypothetical protein